MHYIKDEIKLALSKNNMSVTKARMAILDCLLKNQPASPQLLITSLPEIDRATIYRTINLFVSLDIVKKVYTGFKYAIEIGDSFQEHHHHITCLNCGTVIDLHSQELEYAIEQSALNNGFKPVRHDLEIAGYCANCHR